jgi:hypothetical protein
VKFHLTPCLFGYPTRARTWDLRINIHIQSMCHNNPWSHQTTHYGVMRNSLIRICWYLRIKYGPRGSLKWDELDNARAIAYSALEDAWIKAKAASSAAAQAYPGDKYSLPRRYGAIPENIERCAEVARQQGETIRCLRDKAPTRERPHNAANKRVHAVDGSKRRYASRPPSK